MSPSPATRKPLSPTSTTPAAELLAAVRILASAPYDAAAMRVVSRALLVEVEAARAMVASETRDAEKREVA